MIVLRAFLCALAFLTRIPVLRTAVPPPRVAGLSIAFFPLIGLLLGGAAAAIAWGLRDGLHAPPHLWWALVLVGAHALLTGALHLDGLADVVDGLGGGRGDRERTLAIMRDTRIGSFGVVALVLFLTAKVVVMNEAIRMDESLTVLLMGPVAARFAAVPLVVFFPCARPDGLARDFHDHSGWPAATVAAATAGGAVWFVGPSVLIPSAAALGAAIVVGIWMGVRLKGLTGDTYGAAIELAELSFLFAATYPRIVGAAS